MSARPRLEITPEPTPEERAAIEAAVAQALDGQPGGSAPAAWWEAGVREATEDADER